MEIKLLELKLQLNLNLAHKMMVFQFFFVANKKQKHSGEL